ncbi:type IV pilus modification protein PilV [Pseudoxanthomonas koreensis]|uniref:type IV pilus modification protein PilV n=1 Tax=Pseudoxanthomonas koreensis TaxID=266061 RepID=UPI0035A6EDC2
MKRTLTFSPRQAAGFSLIEVMIAILVMALGLLGFALLQTMSVRFTQSANQRTQAANLAYDMLDQMRTNRLTAAQYADDDYAATSTPASCVPGATVGADAYKTVWQCRLGKALGADASAVVACDTSNCVGGGVSVDITWRDQRWNDADNDGTVADTEGNQTFRTVTRL